MLLKNYMEEVVSQLLEQVIRDIPMCRCEKCRQDIAAIALNNLPAKYVVTEQGEVYSKVNTLLQQFEVDVILAITKASMTVKDNPQHGRVEA
jgi:competence protein ComFB